MWPFGSKTDLKLDADLAQYVKDAPQPSGSATNPVRPVPKREVATVGKSTHQAAMDNCIEFEKAFSACLQSGKYIDRVGSCQSQKQMHDKCVQLQTQVLNVMGYPSANPTDKWQIKGRADDLMIEKCPTLEITTEQAASVEEYLNTYTSS